MTNLFNIFLAIISMLPTPIVAVIGLVFFIGILVGLLKLIKMILDAIPFV